MESTARGLDAPRTIRVFISSTFRDMHAERDTLVTVVFPELRERLERLGLDFFDVDLRWGVPQTGVDGERANSWAYCKQWIDRVEPFFVCLLGQRYGWTPPAEEIQDPADRSVYAGLSITEMEIRHAVVSGRRPRSYFYLRETEVPPDAAPDVSAVFVDPGQQHRLRALKSTIRETGRPVRQYACRWRGQGFADLDAFGQLVLEDLWSGVLRDERYVSKDVWRTVLGRDPDSDALYTDDSNPIPEGIWQRLVEHGKPAALSPLDAEAEEMAAFAAARLRWFRGRAHELSQLRWFVDKIPGPDVSRVCVVRGIPGAGKSALVAQLSQQLSTSPHLVITHFVGATEPSADVRNTLERLVGELDRHGIPHADDGDAKTDLESLRQLFAARLETYDGGRCIVLLIDGVNQLTDGHDLSWLPHRLGPNVRVILSCIDVPASDASAAGRVIAALDRRIPKPMRVDLSGLSEDDVEGIVSEYLREYCKELEPAERKTIREMEQAKNPLYLLVMLHELRTLGGEGIHLKVREIIADLRTHYPDTVSLFDWMLQRLEVFGEETVRRWWIYLSLSRVGMSGRELSDLLGRARGEDASRAASRLERSVRRYLQRRGPQWDFFHGQLREAVTRRYSPGDATSYHADIARYFESRWRDNDRHAISELPYHETRAEMWEQLARTLCDLKFIEGKCSAGMTYDLVDNYDAALEALPDAHRDREARRRLDENLKRYVTEILDYARDAVEARDHGTNQIEDQLRRSMTSRPAPPQAVRKWTEEEVAANTERLIANPTGLERIRAFAQFVDAESYSLARFAQLPGFVVQQAYNWTSSGPVTAAAQSLFTAEPATLLLQQTQRAWNPYPAELRKLFGHTSSVNAVALTLDGRRVVSASSDYTVRVWDVTNGKCLHVLAGHAGWVRALAVSPDGTIGVSGSDDRTLRVWDLDTGHCLQTLTGHTEKVSAAALTPDRRYAVSSEVGEMIRIKQRLPSGRLEVEKISSEYPGSRLLRVWDLANGKCVQTLAGHTEPVMSIDVSLDGQRLVSGSADHTVRVWDFLTGQCVSTLDGHTNWVTAVAFTPDGQRVVSGSHDRTLRVWDLATGQCLNVLDGHRGAVLGVSVTADGARAISTSGDGRFKVWDLTTGTCLQTLGGSGVAVTADGSRAVSSTQHGQSLSVWDLDRGECLQTLKWHASIEIGALAADGRVGISISNSISGSDLQVWDLEKGLQSSPPVRVESIALTADGHGALSASGSTERAGALRVWDLSSPQCLQTMPINPERNRRVGEIPAIAVTDDGRYAITGSRYGSPFGDDQTLRIWDLTSGSCLHVIDQTGAVALTPDGRRVVGGCEYSIRVWDLITGSCLHTLKGQEGQLQALALTGDGRRAVAGSSAGLRVWDLVDGCCLHALTDHLRAMWPGLESSRHDIQAVAVTPDGRRGISGAWDGTVSVWDLASGLCLQTVRGPERVRAIAVTPDGQRAVTGSGRLCVWDLQTGACRAVLAGHTHWIDALALTADGRRALTGSADGTIRFWDLETGQCLQTLAVRSGRVRALALTTSGCVYGTEGEFGIVQVKPKLMDGAPQVVVTRLWRYGENGGRGKWDNRLTTVCFWCGHRFELDDRRVTEILGTEIRCQAPDCGQSLQLAPFVCDPSDVLSN